MVKKYTYCNDEIFLVISFYDYKFFEEAKCAKTEFAMQKKKCHSERNILFKTFSKRMYIKNKISPVGICDVDTNQKNNNSVKLKLNED